jgi:hypothetical protein
MRVGSKAPSNPNLFEPQSLLPGNGIFGAETKRSKRFRKGQGHRGRDNVSLNNPANSGLVVENREISIGTKVRGGPGRCATSTAHQGLAERCGEKGTVGGPKGLAALPAPEEQLTQHNLPPLSLQLRCDWCNTPFSPRRASGGSPQKYCSDECRKISNRERQRTQRIASYAGPTILPASGQPTKNETLTREPAEAALHPWETGVLNIANCQRTEFVVALMEGETAGTSVETWPPELRALMDHHVGRWVEENKETRTVRAVTAAAPKYDGVQSCVLILHHSHKEKNRRDDKLNASSA